MYCCTFLIMFVQKYFRSTKLIVRLNSKPFAKKSSWFCFNNSRFNNSKRIYHLLFQYKISFFTCHFWFKIELIVFRIYKDIVFKFSRSFSFLRCFIEVFWTKERIRTTKKLFFCNILSTFCNFNENVLKIEFCLKTSRITFLDSRFS